MRVNGGHFAVSTLPAADILGELTYESFSSQVSHGVALTGLRRSVARCRSAMLSALFALGARTLFHVPSTPAVACLGEGVTCIIRPGDLDRSSSPNLNSSVC